MEFQESKTFSNLLKAYEGELKASTKYRIYGANAESEGYQNVGRIFEETSNNEKEHAEIWLRLIHNGEIPGTLENLEEAYSGERKEWQEMYREFSETAKEEGYDEIARLFDSVGYIEHHHDYRFERLAESLRKENVFCKDQNSIWICMNCGYVVKSVCAPKKCPVCGYPQGYFKLVCEDY